MDSVVTLGTRLQQHICEVKGSYTCPCMTVHVEELDAEGELVSLSVLNVHDCQHLLGVHANSGAFVWELR